jgi:hypothetical protein
MRLAIEHHRLHAGIGAEQEQRLGARELGLQVRADQVGP